MLAHGTQIATRICTIVCTCIFAASCAGFIAGTAPLLCASIAIGNACGAVFSFEIAQMSDRIADIFDANYAMRLYISSAGAQGFVNEVTKTTRTGLFKPVGNFLLSQQA
jgi:hypothetical protein